MSMIKCPECGREISDKATVCPGCGAPVDASQITTENKDNLGSKLQEVGKAMQQEGQKIENTGKAISSIVMSVVLLIIIVFLFKACS